MTDSEGRVLIEGFYDGADPIGEKMRALVDELPEGFLPEASDLGIAAYTRPDALAAMFFEPRMCVCGIEGVRGRKQIDRHQPRAAFPEAGKGRVVDPAGMEHDAICRRAR